jgi:hypothetical protein
MTIAIYAIDYFGGSEAGCRFTQAQRERSILMKQIVSDESAGMTLFVSDFGVGGLKLSQGPDMLVLTARQTAQLHQVMPARSFEPTGCARPSRCQSERGLAACCAGALGQQRNFRDDNYRTIIPCDRADMKPCPFCGGEAVRSGTTGSAKLKFSATVGIVLVRHAKRKTTISQPSLESPRW